MRRLTTLSLTMTSILLAGSAHAQFNKAPIVDFRSESARQIESPADYNPNGVVKAQYYRAEDLSPEQLDVILVEAERVKQFQAASNVRASGAVQSPYQTATPYQTPTYAQQAYQRQSYQTPVSAPSQARYSQPSHSHDHMTPAARAQHIEYYHSNPNAHNLTVQANTGQYRTAQSYPYQSPSVQPVNAIRNLSHTVTKGETLYSISRRYQISISDLQRMNGIRDTVISVGQVLTVPGATHATHRVAPGASPVVSFASAPNTTTVPQTGRTVRRVTRPVDELPVLLSANGSSDAIYAVLPKDTLYHIARRSCLSVGMIVNANGIDPSVPLRAGQRLTIPTGHCLAN